MSSRLEYDWDRIESMAREMYGALLKAVITTETSGYRRLALLDTPSSLVVSASSSAGGACSRS